MKVLFVCTGNTCRSPMAEGILKYMLSKRDINSDKAEVMSAGLSANSGEYANAKSIKALKNQGIDISHHKALQLNIELIQNADIILTMSSMHKQIIIDNLPQSLDKVFTLKEFSNKINKEIVENNNLDIADPYGMDYNVYEQCMYEIKRELEKSIDGIIKWRQK